MNSEPSDQLWLPGFEPGADVFAAATASERPVGDDLMERICERGNLLLALQRVERNNGCPGIDGMAVGELRSFLRSHWRALREALLRGQYRPAPVRRVEIPKDSGGQRPLGIPTALDRFIQQAVLQVLQPIWDPTFSEASHGFRPGHSAHQAVAQAQQYIRSGYGIVVDLDLEKFFDRVNHDVLMHEVRKRISDRRVLRLIRRYLVSGVLIHGALHETPEGTPQGGPLSPLLANILLDRFDTEMEHRGHRFVRYADDCNIYVRSRRAGLRVLGSVTRFLATRLKLSVNQAKSTVARPCERQFLGFTINGRCRRSVSTKALRRWKARIREITRRTRGRTISDITAELARYLIGWRAYYGYTESQSIFKEMDSWVRRRLRCYLWKQWGRRGYKELRRRGISVRLAWNTCKSAHGPWRLSRSPALAYALPGAYFDSLGVPRLHRKPT